MKVFLNHCYYSKIVFSWQLKNVADSKNLRLEPLTEYRWSIP